MEIKGILSQILISLKDTNEICNIIRAQNYNE